MIECHQLDAEATTHLWPDLLPHVAQAIARDPYISITVEEIAQQLEGGFAQMLVAVDDGQILGASVVQMFKRGDKRILHVLTTAGVDLDRWITPMLAEFEALSAAQQIDAITLSGRPGWTRTLRPFGYRTDQVQMIKELQNGSEQEQAKVVER